MSALDEIAGAQHDLGSQTLDVAVLAVDATLRVKT
jgi:predicted alpha/beta-hydrolase family hydrolase